MYLGTLFRKSTMFYVNFTKQSLLTRYFFFTCAECACGPLKTELLCDLSYSTIWCTVSGIKFSKLKMSGTGFDVSQRSQPRGIGMLTPIIFCVTQQLPACAYSVPPVFFRGFITVCTGFSRNQQPYTALQPTSVRPSLHI